MKNAQPLFDSATQYRIEVRGQVDVDWLQGFDSSAEITVDAARQKEDITVLNIHTDQSGIVGLVRGLGMAILQVQVVSDARGKPLYAKNDANANDRLTSVTRYQGTDMSQSMSLNSQNNYEIKFFGQLDDSWLGWFGEAKALVEIVADNSQATTFSNVVMDQAGLVGLIRRLHGLGIVLISIRQV